MAERTPEPADADTALHVEMAAERTWLARWRSALVATAGALGVGRWALGVGRLAPRLLRAAPAPYIVLGGCYALLASALLIVGLVRHRAIERAVERDEPAPLAATTVVFFTIGGLVLAMVTTVTRPRPDLA